REMNPNAAPPTIRSTAANLAISLTRREPLVAGKPYVLLHALLEVDGVPVDARRVDGVHASLAVEKVGLGLARRSVALVDDGRERVGDDRKRGFVAVGEGGKGAGVRVHGHGEHGQAVREVLGVQALEREEIRVVPLRAGIEEDEERGPATPIRQE